MARVRAELSDAEIVEIVLDLVRNAANKIAVSLGGDEAVVTDGIEYYDVDAPATCSPTSTARPCGPPPPHDADPVNPPRAARMQPSWLVGRGIGRWAVRVLAAFGVLLMTLGAFGWWLSTRVLRPRASPTSSPSRRSGRGARRTSPTRRTLRLARTSNFVSAARPVVSDAIAAAIATPPVEEAIHDFAQRAHEQVFQASGARRVDVDSQEAAVTIRSALQTINPALAKKLPANVLDATTTISQSEHRRVAVPDVAVGRGPLPPRLPHRRRADRSSRCVTARERVHAIRTVGVTLAVAGGLLSGIGFATPAFATVAGTTRTRSAATRSPSSSPCWSGG